MGALVISCVSRNDSPHAHNRIECIGGLCPDTGKRWYLPAEEAIAGILNNTHAFQVIIGSRHADVVVERHPEGQLYLKTSADGPLENNLLLRPQCPLS